MTESTAARSVDQSRENVTSARSLRNARIQIAGVIGVGKTTLSVALSKALGLKIYPEDVEGNPYLEVFYENMADHAFALQVHLLIRRIKQQQKIVWKGAGGIQDRSINEDRIFAEVLRDMAFMSQANFDTYVELAETMFYGLSKPDLIVYLTASPEVCFARIQERIEKGGRDMEKGITLEYLQKLHAVYEREFDEISKSGTLVIKGRVYFFYLSMNET
jgi:deoxyadenosine kinase